MPLHLAKIKMQEDDGRKYVSYLLAITCSDE
jgi:hypothetical protein